MLTVQALEVQHIEVALARVHIVRDGPVDLDRHIVIRADPGVAVILVDEVEVFELAVFIGETIARPVCAVDE